MKSMILTLQLDFQEERCKRECLEEKVRKLEGDLTRKSNKTPERKWRLSDMRVLDEEIPESKPRPVAPNTIKGVNKIIEELRSEFDFRLVSLDQSLLDIRSIQANHSAGGQEDDRKVSLGPVPSENKDYNRFLYKKLERGIFPRQMSLKNAITKSVDELLHKPRAEKTEIEAIMDQYYLDNLPPAFLQPDDIENEDHTPMNKLTCKPISNRDTRRKIL